MTARSLVQASAERAPEAPALRYLSASHALGSLTFRQVWNLSGLIAAKLTGGVLAVAIDDGPYLALSELAAWRAGMVIVPMDPHDPIARLQGVFEEAGATCVVTKDWGDAKKLANVSTVLDLSVEVPLDSDELSSWRDAALDPEDVAYMWFTSGSTGKPKGVLVSHRAFHNWCLVKPGPHGITAQSVVLIASASTFDPSIGDIFSTWAVGAQVAVAPRMLFFANLGWTLNQLSITHVTCTPSLWQSLEAGVDLDTLTTLCLGGERSPQPLLDAWSPRLIVLNTYGTTECTVWQTLRRMRPGDRATLVGEPFAGNEIRIVRQGGTETVPDGETGEIVQGGVQVGIGYHNRPELTAERFVPLPPLPGRWYRTGDGGRIVDGELEVMGRFDNQVKIRGMRVELGDIEAGVVKASGGLLTACAVVLRDTFLHAYCQVSEDAAVMMHEAFCVLPAISNFLLRESSLTLPRHMLPSRFVLMQKFPLTQNGKVDNKNLPEVTEAAATASGSVTALTPLERVVAGVWADVLGRPNISANDHFLALGGHSTSVLQVSRRLLALAKEAGQDVGPATPVGILLSPEKLIHSPRLRLYCQMLARGGIRLPGGGAEKDPVPCDGSAAAVGQATAAPTAEETAAANLRINYTKHKVKRARTEADEEKKELDHSAWEQVPQASDGQLLCEASEAGLLPLVRLLLDRGAPPEGEPAGPHKKHGLTPLHLATLGSHGCCAQLLLERGADAMRRDAHGTLPLHKASERSGAPAVEILAAAGADPEAIDTASRSTALHAAAKAGNLATVQALISRGVCLDWLDRWNRTPLHWAVFNGHTEVCRALVEAKATLEGVIGERGGRFLFSERACGQLPARVVKRAAALELPAALARTRLGENHPLVGLLSAARVATAADGGE